MFFKCSPASCEDDLIDSCSRSLSCFLSGISVRSPSNCAGIDHRQIGLSRITNEFATCQPEIATDALYLALI